VNGPRSGLPKLALVVGLAIVVWIAGAGPAAATHWIPYYYTWLDLAPSGDGHLIYSACPAVGAPPQWAQGVENWDASMFTLMEFDDVGCNWAQVTMTWEASSSRKASLAPRSDSWTAASS
jgi:hypothetical protein